MTFNKVILLGNLTRDVEKRVTPKGTSVAKFGLAMNRKFKTQDGKPGEEVTFVDVTAYGAQADTLAKFVKKGSPLHIEGRLKFDQWQDKTTKQNRSHLSVVLESFQFIGAAPEKATTAATSANPQPANAVEEEQPPF